MICIGGLHGNEPAGVRALEYVLDRLGKSGAPFRGQLLGVAGNLKALEKGVRYIEQDLNRIWRPAEIDRLLSDREGYPPGDIEEAERKELIKVFYEYCSNKESPVYFLDLHTTSSDGSPFITIADTLRNRAFAKSYPVPIILGIEEQLDSTLLNYINELGYIAIGFEAGRHGEPSSVENCVAALWITLVSAGCLDMKDAEELEDCRSRLKSAARGLSGFYEVRYRHGIEDDSGFKMEPGFQNFQRIQKGNLLARSGETEIRSTENGRIFMPLYQKQGDDGFFILRNINPLWLKVSSLLRKLNAGAVLTSLPGIHGEDGKYETLAIDNKIARWYVIEILHLLGYRRKTRESGKLVVKKRAYDIKCPPDYSFSQKVLNLK